MNRNADAGGGEDVNGDTDVHGDAGVNGDVNAPEGGRPAGGAGEPEAEEVPAGDDGEYEIPPGAEVFACPRCGRPFARERHRDLHLGHAHAGLDEEERAAYEDASGAERAELRRFRIVALGLLVVLYFGFLFLYAIAG